MTQFSNIKAVLFDMDGTLIRHTWQYSQITDALFKKFAPALAPLTAEEFYKVFWTKNVDMWFMMLDGVIDGDTAQLYSYVNTLRALDKDASLGIAMMEYWESLVLDEAVPFEDTMQVLKAVRTRFTTGIVTNGFNRMQYAKIKKYGLAEAVDFCLVSEEVQSHKPDQRIFEIALEKAGNFPAEQVLFVGDNPVNDIEGALHAGLQPIFFDPDCKHAASLPNSVTQITNLSALLPLLNIPSR